MTPPRLNLIGVGEMTPIPLNPTGTQIVSLTSFSTSRKIVRVSNLVTVTVSL
ncbi:hypothetical protein LCGC14_3004850, partial [marine sediment metagenome]